MLDQWHLAARRTVRNEAPDAFRQEFTLSTSMAGTRASGGFLTSLPALLASAWTGPERRRAGLGDLL